LKAFKKVAVIGGGLIGMSWTSLFLARGLDVVAVDPRPEAEDESRAFVEQAWPMLRALEHTTINDIRHAGYATDVSRLTDIDFVQECGPERIEVKQALVQQLEDVIAADVLIASSTSSLMASDIQSEAKHPDRMLVGHPMNPPHMVPMVELVPGIQTSEQTMKTAETFYKKMQRVTIRVQKEVPGHLANRLTSEYSSIKALFHESDKY
jgi:3-hydroxyacyl-CoA dehydrogenase